MKTSHGRPIASVLASRELSHVGCKCQVHSVFFGTLSAAMVCTEMIPLRSKRVTLGCAYTLDPSSIHGQSRLRRVRRLLGIH